MWESFASHCLCFYLTLMPLSIIEFSAIRFLGLKSHSWLPANCLCSLFTAEKETANLLFPNCKDTPELQLFLPQRQNSNDWKTNTWYYKQPRVKGVIIRISVPQQFCCNWGGSGRKAWKDNRKALLWKEFITSPSEEIIMKAGSGMCFRG